MPPSGAAHRFALASLGGGPRPAFALAVGAPAPSARPPLALLAPLRGYGRAVSFWQAAPAKPAIGAFAPFAGMVASLPFAGSACQKAVFFGLRTACIMKSSVSPRPDVVTLPSFFGQLPWGPSVQFHDAGIKVSFAPIPSFVSCRPSVGTSLLAWATFGFAISHARLESWAGASPFLPLIRRPFGASPLQVCETLRFLTPTSIGASPQTPVLGGLRPLTPA